MNRTQAQLPPAGTRPASDGVFDGAALLKRVQGDKDLAAEVVAVFRADVPVQLSRLQDWLAGGEWPDLQLHAHALKGAAATVGAEAMRETAWQLELAARAADQNTPAELLSALKAQFRELESMLDETGWC
ncbi:MAG: Hpt domain-containing protein [Bryobacteraceae bacterium]|jgi:HPt (histidine-containing phosphotransfer) domain-containing protein